MSMTLRNIGRLVVSNSDEYGPLVEWADDEVEIAAWCVDHPDERFVVVEDDILTINASNGTWRYRLESFDNIHKSFRARRLP